MRTSRKYKSSGRLSSFVLPSSHFDLALLWEPDMAISARQVSADRSEFPSWSRCEWRGAKMRYKTDMVDGCLGTIDRRGHVHSSHAAIRVSSDFFSGAVDQPPFRFLVEDDSSVGEKRHS